MIMPSCVCYTASISKASASIHTFIERKLSTVPKAEQQKHALRLIHVERTKKYR